MRLSRDPTRIAHLYLYRAEGRLVAYMIDVSEQKQIELQLAQAQLKHPKWLEGAEITSAAAAFRATLPDHLPVVGAVTGQSGLYLFGALGARGIMLSPLLAELLACQICAEPLPLNLSLINRLSANRF